VSRTFRLRPNQLSDPLGKITIPGEPPIRREAVNTCEKPLESGEVDLSFALDQRCSMLFPSVVPTLGNRRRIRSDILAAE
jgi:hypothetical protein